ncbi:site-2 protease family protein [Candidatus Aerophobetes bacterium]|nr:site-2 protease family protein [Candidatus Aerophobetes bacterium]
MDLRKSISKKIFRIKIPHLNSILLLATIATTVWAGYINSLPLVKLGLLESVWHGAITFSLGIMGIIGCHEMGHKLMADVRKIKASFPYFIPAPTFIGTFGAVIRMRTRPQDRNSLFDVGVAGPLGGILITIPVTILGLSWSFSIPAELVPEETIALPAPLLFQWLSNWLISLPSENVLLLHPLAFAGWVGMVITMLNLMPIGMLDGGHISRALFGNKYRIISMIGIGIMLLLGYWLMALLIIFLGLFRHTGPVDDTIPLSNGRKILGIGVACLLVICATPLHIILR